MPDWFKICFVVNAEFLSFTAGQVDVWSLACFSCCSFAFLHRYTCLHLWSLLVCRSFWLVPQGRYSQYARHKSKRFGPLISSKRSNPWFIYFSPSFWTSVKLCWDLREQFQTESMQRSIECRNNVQDQLPGYPGLFLGVIVRFAVLVIFEKGFKCWWWIKALTLCSVSTAGVITRTKPKITFMDTFFYIFFLGCHIKLHPFTPTISIPGCLSLSSSSCWLGDSCVQF